MERSLRRHLVPMLAGAVLIGQAGCAERTGAQLTPTAALPCPPWVEFPADPHVNEDAAYLGCVNAVNLENMVESPDDLTHGRTLGPASGERQSIAVDAYNQGKVKTPTSGGAATPTIIMPAAAGGGGAQ